MVALNGEAAGGNVEVKCASVGVADRNEDQAIGHWKKGDPCLTWQKGPELGIHLAQSSSLTIEGIKIRERESEADVLSTYMES